MLKDSAIFCVPVLLLRNVHEQRLDLQGRSTAHFCVWDPSAAIGSSEGGGEEEEG